ncbi:urokinase plasminogen activator surface receptor-like [Sinocyclocheilus rhinocerous]|uniref:urokinase plasminogen activator surface receptor-like n=1 Tax=Sinocyclocheilus rhinocerous TaxID=307959 RepID=UPI0007BA4F4C|nr:PREDICTED: urokinase plasminogen activator surface receptor-like [Sinocyclocheilus rhinocerous]
MDRQISVFLLFILFTSGHSLKCNLCLEGSCRQETCDSGQTSCLSETYFHKSTFSLYNTSVKRCAPAGDCVSGFINLGSIKISSSCCNTDLCNDKDAPDPSNVPNGKQCYHCDGHNCSSILRCSGSEDRCFTATGDLGGMLLLAKGCVSKSACNATKLFSLLRISCCEGNLCNGAQSITQSFLFLCCSLLSFILLH